MDLLPDEPLLRARALQVLREHNVVVGGPGEINVKKHRQLLLCENNLLEVIDHGPDVQPGVADVVLGAGDLAREAALGVLLNINLNQNPYFDEMINIA